MLGGSNKFDTRSRAGVCCRSGDLSRSANRSTISANDIVKTLHDVDLPAVADIAAGSLVEFKGQHASSAAVKKGAAAKRKRASVAAPKADDGTGAADAAESSATAAAAADGDEQYDSRGSQRRRVGDGVDENGDGASGSAALSTTLADGDIDGNHVSFDTDFDGTHQVGAAADAHDSGYVHAAHHGLTTPNGDSAPVAIVDGDGGGIESEDGST